MKNLFDIKGKVIVITGGCGILGKNIANYLAEQGAKIVILDRVEDLGKQLEAELNQKTEALFLTTDVLNKEVLEENKKAIVERFGTIDILLNAAGGNMAGATIAPDKTFLDLDIDAFRKVVDLNLFGTILPTTVFVPVMAHAKQERRHRQLLFGVGIAPIDPCRRLWRGQVCHRQLHTLHGYGTRYQVQSRTACQRHCAGLLADQPEPCPADQSRRLVHRPCQGHHRPHACRTL